MSRFSDRVRALSGVSDDASARRVIRATLSVIFEQLSPSDQAWLAHAIAGDADGLALASSQRLADGLDDFYARIAAREGAELGFATEHAQSVCRALAEALHDDARRRLMARLPEAIALQFILPQPDSAPPHDRPRAQHHTLAQGRSGSRRPLSESAPQRAQRESVARSDNPHADTKLSSNRGTTQQREAHTLADHQPDSPSRRRS